MNIFITFDYELYFGSVSGTAERCIIGPVEELIRIANRNGVRFSFFVDAGYLLKMEEMKRKFPILEKDHHDVVAQVQKLSVLGHDVQLHIHPHWEDSYFDGQQWVMNTDRYKLTDFSVEQIRDIVVRYKKALTDITGKPVFVNRGGGWCIQPFEKLKQVLVENNVSVDSTVFPGGYFNSGNYYYDFRNSPNKTSWRFDADPVKETVGGYFTEVAISSIRCSPLFYWKLFLLGRIDPFLHKPLGDGLPMAAPGYRRTLLTSYTDQTVSVEGYNAHLLEKALKQHVSKNNGQEFVVIGHPKSMSRYSLLKLDEFIQENKSTCQFVNFSSWDRQR